MCRPHSCGEHQFCRIDIDGDNRTRTREPRALHGRETYGAAADHHHGIAMRDRAEIERRTGAGHDATTDQAGAVERNLLRHRNGLLVGHHAVFAERAQKHELLQLLAVGERGARLPVESNTLRPFTEILLAKDRRIAVAVKAVPAMRIP